MVRDGIARLVGQVASGAAGHKSRAFIYTCLDQGLDLVELYFVDDGANVAAAFMGWAHLDNAGNFCRCRNRLIINFALYQHPRRGVARLPGIVHTM